MSICISPGQNSNGLVKSRTANTIGNIVFIVQNENQNNLCQKSQIGLFSVEEEECASVSRAAESGLPSLPPCRSRIQTGDEGGGGGCSQRLHA